MHLWRHVAGQSLCNFENAWQRHQRQSRQQLIHLACKVTTTHLESTNQVGWSTPSETS